MSIESLLRSPIEWESYWESYWMNIGSLIHSLLRVLLNESYWKHHWMNIESPIDSEVHNSRMLTRHDLMWWYNNNHAHNVTIVYHYEHHNILVYLWLQRIVTLLPTLTTKTNTERTLVSGRSLKLWLTIIWLRKLVFLLILIELRHYWGCWCIVGGLIANRFIILLLDYCDMNVNRLFLTDEYYY